MPYVAVFYSLFPDPWLCVYFVAAGMRELVMYGVRLREQLGSCSNISIYTRGEEIKADGKMGKLGGKKKRAMSYFRIPGTHGAHAKKREKEKLFPFPDTLAVWESSLRQKQNSERSMLP